MQIHFGLMRLCALSLFIGYVFNLQGQTTICGISVNAGPDQVFCSAGQTLQLNGTVSGDFLTAQWSPSTGLADANSLNTTLTPNSATTYNLTVRSLVGPNLVNNGEFSQGNTGFTTSYNLGTNGQWGPVSNPGTFGITTVANLVHSQFAPCTDHTGGGNMMVVNGATSPTNIWCQTVTVQPNTNYAFSAWFAVVATQNPSILRFAINNSTIGNNFTLPSVTCEWTRFFRIWNSGAAATAQICIANVSTFSAGNDFCLDDISLREVCETIDPVSITPANLNAIWNDPGTLCENNPVITLASLLTPASTPGGEWTLNGVTAMSFDPAVLGPGNHTLAYRVQLGICSQQLSRSITVAALPRAGSPLPPLQTCGGAIQLVSLRELLVDADPGGSWTETSVVSSAPGAFSASNGTLQTQFLLPGSYTFQYRLAGTAPCAEATATVNVTIVPGPVADAGPDQVLDCRMQQVSVGGGTSSSAPGISFVWSSPSGGSVLQPGVAITEVEAPGTYVLTVRDAGTGCEAHDTVLVNSLITSPQFTLDTRPVTCFGLADGSITVSGISGAAEPVTFQINGGSPEPTGVFEGLTSGTYTIRLEDANGCFAEQLAVLPESSSLMLELSSDLGSDPPILPLGESTRLRVLTNLAPNQIQSLSWSPAIPDCDNCLEASVSPISRTTYTVALLDINGCRDTAELTLFIERRQRVFVPNAFSPNDDGINDKLILQAGPEVAQILSFRVADRWGNIVYQQQNIPPNDPQYGWDGRVKGKAVSGGVFMYVVEAELLDGTRVVVSGDAAVLR